MDRNDEDGEEKVCQRCKGSGCDPDGADCMACEGMGSVILRG